MTKRHHDVQDSLQEGFEIPKGMPEMKPVATATPPRPRLCAAGPCAHYHRFQIQLAAADPGQIAVAAPVPATTPSVRQEGEGQFYTPPRVFHIQEHHYCYPTTGVEMELGDLPVLECNRWSPQSDLPQALAADTFNRSPAGQQFAAEVAAWEAARQAELEAAAKAEALIQESLDAATSRAERIAAQVERYSYETRSSRAKNRHSPSHAVRCVELDLEHIAMTTPDEVMAHIKAMAFERLAELQDAGKPWPDPINQTSAAESTSADNLYTSPQKGPTE